MYERIFVCHEGEEEKGPMKRGGEKRAGVKVLMEKEALTSKRG